MNDSNRGKIRNRRLAGQHIDYSQMRYKKCTPTDLDGYMEINGTVYVFFEFKHEDAEFPAGQRRALASIADAIAARTLVVVGRHHVPVEIDIEAPSCWVSEYRYAKEWREPKSPIRVGPLVYQFLKAKLPEQQEAVEYWRAAYARHIGDE